MCPPAYSDLVAADEAVAAPAHSVSYDRKFTASFTNTTLHNVDLVWKNYEGAEVGTPPTVILNSRGGRGRDPSNSHSKQLRISTLPTPSPQVVVRQDIAPGVRHAESTFFSHPFLARCSDTKLLCSFAVNFISGTVFEGEEFGAQTGGRLEVNIECELDMFCDY